MAAVAGGAAAAGGAAVTRRAAAAEAAIAGGNAGHLEQSAIDDSRDDRRLRDRVLAGRDARALIEPALVARPGLDVGRIDVAVRPVRGPRAGGRQRHPVARDGDGTVGDEPGLRERRAP